jgi:hypothetical protein
MRTLNWVAKRRVAAVAGGESWEAVAKAVAEVFCWSATVEAAMAAPQEAKVEAATLKICWKAQ